MLTLNQAQDKKMNDKANLDYEELMRKVKARQEDLTRKMNERPKPKRKVVQLVADTTCDCLSLYALCDDGSMWEGNPGHCDGWSRIEDIPQD